MSAAGDVASAIRSARARAVSLVRSPLAVRPPGVLRHNHAVPARHRGLLPSHCLRGWRAGCLAILEIGPARPPASELRRTIVVIDCADRQGGGIGQPPEALSAQLRRWPCAAPDRLRTARRGSRRIAAGWWPWHPNLISRDASRVQWIGMHHQLGVPTAVCRAGRGARPPVVSKQLGVPS